ncbi:hypothetical protein IMG5_184110 [Ichthyophthirius multifiliis]|uniref:Uncharacterized protein n=1 Tax=Ichthyophthirius multifiliis TaxID=5932 RepID=G0R3A3_ICHMU|nr:hypothetical protein IMG5_184110 [Ichthyophthirius multifiliis]EGR28046.1 hypothetical protein IMG5_184110 [Ichthyophthirius multifiliis]|eukprot:XP_004027391.1 hypothetical protein IMG5_184110 [Ichthyophthirius multifiliis]
MKKMKQKIQTRKYFNQIKKIINQNKIQMNNKLSSKVFQKARKYKLKTLQNNKTNNIIKKIRTQPLQFNKIKFQMNKYCKFVMKLLLKTNFQPNKLKILIPLNKLLKKIKFYLRTNNNKYKISKALQKNFKKICNKKIQFKIKSLNFKNKFSFQNYKKTRNQTNIRVKKITLKKNLMNISKKQTKNTKKNIDFIRGNLKGKKRYIKGKKRYIKGKNRNLKGKNRNIKRKNRNIKGKKRNIKGKKRNIKGKKRNIKGKKRSLNGKRTNSIYLEINSKGK